jgi:hypothetical protein
MTGNVIFLAGSGLVLGVGRGGWVEGILKETQAISRREMNCNPPAALETPPPAEINFSLYSSSSSIAVCSRAAISDGQRKECQSFSLHGTGIF